MAWKQIVSPNVNAAARAGYCLEYVDNTFGAPHISDTAKHSWQLAVGRGTAHADRNLPPVSVPVYFSWYGNVGGVSSDYGHVVTYVPGEGFYSVNWHTSGHQVFPSIDAVTTALPGTYLGWAEEVDTLRVAQYEADPIIQSGLISHASGRATVLVDQLNIRNDPTTSAALQGYYSKGQTFNYDGFIDGDGHRWLTYISYSGTRRYVAENGSDGAYVSGGI